jgi:predicted AlkP superfamily phosphohydrolase/phosphomutase
MTRARATAVLAAAVLVLAGCSGRPSFTVTIVGIDGAAWRVIDPLLAEGALPNLAALIAGGVRGPLRSELPLISPPVWTTIATGVSRARHGIHGFTGPGRIVMSLDRRAPALWTLASAAGIPTAVIGWWATYPAEVIDGVVVSERALKLREEDLGVVVGERRGEAKLGNLVYPADALPRLEDILAAPSPTTGPLGEAARMRTEDTSVARALERLRETMGPFGLELVLLRGVDVVSHHYWRFHEPDAAAYAPGERPTSEEVAEYGRVVRDHYRVVDGLLGGLASASRAHAVLVISDHGFEAGHQPFGSETVSGTHKSEAALDGILVAAGGPLAVAKRVDGATILDVAPTVLHLLGLAVPAGLEGRVLTDAFDPGWLAEHPVRAGPAYSDLPVTAPPASDRGLENRLHDELRALGYVE